MSARRPRRRDHGSSCFGGRLLEGRWGRRVEEFRSLPLNGPFRQGTHGSQHAFLDEAPDVGVEGKVGYVRSLPSR